MFYFLFLFYTYTTMLPILYSYIKKSKHFNISYDKWCVNLSNLNIKGITCLSERQSSPVKCPTISSNDFVAGISLRSSTDIPHITLPRFLNTDIVKFGFLRPGWPIVLFTFSYKTGHWKKKRNQNHAVQKNTFKTADYSLKRATMFKKKMYRNLCTVSKINSKMNICTNSQFKV